MSRSHVKGILHPFLGCSLDHEFFVSSPLEGKGMFTVTISDKPVAVANTDDEARELFLSGAFKRDLLTLENEGAPLWDGAATLKVRPASELEIKAFEEAEVDDDEVDRHRQLKPV
jgi:hypothetical protein